MTRPLPMFPLNTVLFPGVGLPLHVFEPRYRLLTRHCLDSDRRFGVVLIERGSEVGGGDVRSSVGTVARILEGTELPDGRWLLMVVGVERLEVERWLADDPYPRAVVRPLTDPPAGYEAADHRVEVERLLRRVLALKAELGDPAPPATVELDLDPVVAAYQAAALAGLGPFDGQRLLELPTTDQRLDALARLLAETADVLAQRAGGG